ncbi:MAG: NAD(+) diphosphatase [Lachnospiraceae bacterium]|nr:NAD(+) diphosphatase [Lachnospiraceae bacterium]
MIQDIFPHRYDNSFLHRRGPRPDDFVLYQRNEKELLIREELGAFRFPTVSEVGAEGLYFAFLIDDTAFFIGPEKGSRDPGLEGFVYTDQSRCRTLQPKHLAFAGITGMQLIRWLLTQTYCGCCGTKLEESSWERAFICPRCRKTTYPKLMPAVIVAVTHEDKILATAYANRPARGLALIAGFTEIGETVEETVHREVMEEVGIRVKNLRYYKSQPWSFTDTLLMGFYCELDGECEDIVLDREELKEARWIRREDLPDRSGEPALTAEMMQRFKEGKERLLSSVPNDGKCSL